MAGRSMLVVVAFCGAAASSAWAQPQAQAQLSWPVRPVRLIVPFAPGAGTDALSRILGAKLGDDLGQQFIIDNRAGAGGVIGTEIAAKAAPDGYTLLFSPASHATNPAVFSQLSFDTERDFVPVSIVAALPVVLGVESNVPARTVKELVALARAKPGELSAGSSGNGTLFHLVLESFKKAAAVDIVHVPFKGGAPAVQALTGGQVALAFETSLTLLPHVKSGRIRALAVASRSRIALMPDVPTLAEAGYDGIVAENWYGLYVPRGTPRPVVERLSAATRRALASTDLRERMAAQGAEIRDLGPAEAAAFVRTEIARWARIAREANVKIN